MRSPSPHRLGFFVTAPLKRPRLPATLRPAQAAQSHSRYQHGTPLVIVAYAARYVAQFSEAIQAAFD